MSEKINQLSEEIVIEVLENTKNLLLDFKEVQQKHVAEIEKNYNRLQRLPLDEVQKIYLESEKCRSLLTQIDKIEKEL